VVSQSGVLSDERRASNGIHYLHTSSTSLDLLVTAARLEHQCFWGNPICLDIRHQRGQPLDPVIDTQSFCYSKALKFAFSPFALPSRVGLTILTIRLLSQPETVSAVIRSFLEDADLKAFRLY